jgi:methyl-accepting chemotaxis protein
MPNGLPTPREFLLRSVALTTVVSTLGVALMALYLAALLRLPDEQWSAFLRAVAGAFAVLFVTVYTVNLRLFAPLVAFLDAPEAAGDALLRQAYQRVTALPRLTFVTGQAWWVLGALAVALAMRWLAPGFGGFAAGILIAAGTSGGLVVMIFHYFLNKRLLAPLRLALARRLGEPELRERLAARVGLRTKLLVSVTGVTLVVVVFTLLLADSLARRPALAVAAAAQRAYAEEMAASGALDAAALARADARAAALTEQATAGELRTRQAISGLVLLVGGLLAVGVAVVVSRDVVDTVRALARDVARISDGDLRESLALEGEDELGVLSRAFERMTAALRGTVGSVAAAADEVEAAAGRLAEVAGDVAGTTKEQVVGIRQAAGSMDAIRSQIDGITGSSHTLSQSVDESSSSLVELGAAGEQLHATASVLNEKVDTVSSSIDRMIESVRRVVASADDLTGAADETAGGLQEMAATMGHVDANAAETARLSERVIEVAERGRERVRETIEGMEQIRTATAAAHGVIRGLSDRVASIGAILGVIDDVADETNLLALNAAIIAAQAGEQGRAFSVVADEIKELADRVLENTQEIGALIRGVQQEGRSAAEAMERGADRVESGVSLAAEAGVALDEITVAARQSGDHTRGIVSAVKEQATASGHIVGLMDRVRSRVDQIRKAGIQHERGNEVVRRSALSMREVAQQVTQTTREQAHGTATIVRSVERVKDAVAEIHQALQRQGGSSAEAVDFLEQVHARTRSHDESSSVLQGATEGLVEQARGLRESIGRFTL